MNASDTSKMYTRAQLRELVVAYYTRVDPNGLNSGVDVNGIVEWCAYYGKFIFFTFYLLILLLSWVRIHAFVYESNT